MFIINVNMLNILPPEIICLILTSLQSYKDQINFSLSCHYFLDVLIKHSNMITINVNTKSKEHTKILVNLIELYNLSTRKIKLTCPKNFAYIPLKIFKSHNFEHINFINAEESYRTQLIISIVTDKYNNGNPVNFDIDFTMKGDNYRKDYYFNNLDDDQRTDYYETVPVKIYHIPWYITKLNFNQDYKLVTNIKEIKRLNDPLFIPAHCLILYTEADYAITSNCINPKIDFDKWVIALRTKYKLLNTIMISESLVHQDVNKRVINYKNLNDPCIRNALILTLKCICVIFGILIILFYIFYD